VILHTAPRYNGACILHHRSGTLRLLGAATRSSTPLRYRLQKPPQLPRLLVIVDFLAPSAAAFAPIVVSSET
jgi:hypothetical protein